MATLTREVGAVVWRRETAAARGMVFAGDELYWYASEGSGFRFEKDATGARYFVPLAGGKPAGCNCPCGRFRGGRCRHYGLAEAALAAW